jgi:hypothetical protein
VEKMVRQVDKVLQGQRDQLGHKVHLEILEALDQQAHKVHKAKLEHKVYRGLLEPQGPRVSKASRGCLDHRGRREILALIIPASLVMRFVYRRKKDLYLTD